MSDRLQYHDLWIPPTNIRYGGNMSIRYGIINAIQNAPSYTLQIMFTRMSYSHNGITNDEKRKIKRYLELTNTTMYVHFPYTINISKDINNPIRSKSMWSMREHLKTIHGLPSAGVFHFNGKGTISNISDCVNTLVLNGNLKRGDGRIRCKLLGETSAGKGTTIGQTWDEIRHIYESIDTNHMGICLDTQHLFASGMCDFDGHESIVKLFDMTESITGHVDLIHINDSRVVYKSRDDRHMALGKGEIWSCDQQSLISLLYRCFDDSIDVVSESLVFHDIDVMERIAIDYYYQT